MDYPKNFLLANRFTQKWEKGYCNHKNDPGGATYNGVSLRFLKQTKTDINGDGKIDAEDILTLYRNRDQARVDEIFWKAFWRDPKLERLPYLPVQTVFYDTAANTGRTQTAKFLQRACNRLSKAESRLAVDGAVGPKTEGLVHEICQAGHAQALAHAMIEERLSFHNLLVSSSPYPDGRNYKPFAAGWRNRCEDLARYVWSLEKTE